MLRWTCRRVIEEYCQWQAARRRMQECDSCEAYAVICRAAREQVVAQLKGDASQVVQQCSSMHQMQNPSVEDAKETLKEVRRINGVYRNLQHFDAWSPFLHPTVGRRAVADSIHEAMWRAEETWRTNPGAANARDTFKPPYENFARYSHAVSFRSAELPEPYTGNFNADWGALQDTPLIEPFGEKALQLCVNAQRFAALQ